MCTAAAYGGARAAEHGGAGDPRAIAHYAHGLTAKEQGDYVTARMEFLAALRVDSTAADVVTALIETDAASRADSLLLSDVARFVPPTGPPTIDVLLLEAGAHARRGEEAKAEEDLRAAVAAAPDSASLHTLLGHVLIERGDTLGALVAYRDAVRRAPMDAEAHFNLGSALAAADSLDAARSELEASRALDAEQPAVERALGDVERRAGRLEKALAHYGALKHMSPHDPTAYLNRAECLSALGRVDDAARELEEMRGAVATPVAVERGLAILYWRAGRSPAARRHAAALAKLAPNDPLPHEIFGYLAVGADHLSEAEHEFRQALDLDPSATDIRFAIGLLLTRLHRPREAVHDLRLAAAASDAPASAKYLLGVALMASGDTAAARDTLLAARIADPGSPGPPFQLAEIADARGDRATAATFMREVIAHDSTNASAWNYVGYMQAEQGENLTEALDQVQHALRLEPENGAFLDSYGWVLFKLGRFEDALSALEQAVKREPNEGEILEHLGDVYAKLGRASDARRVYRRALERVAHTPRSGSNTTVHSADIEGKLRALPPTDTSRKTTPGGNRP